MTHVTTASRLALENFASRVLAEHSPAEGVLCRSCHQFSPCPVEEAAVEAGLVTPPPTWGVDEHPEWLVTESEISGTVTCETNWRRYGKGHIVVFDRAAVLAGRDPDPVPLSPWARSAWAAARRWAASRFERLLDAE